MTDTASPVLTGLTARTLGVEDADRVAEVVFQAFLADATPAAREREMIVYEPGRYHGVFDGELMIGVAGMLTRSLTVPGMSTLPVAAVTAVGVLPDHRRRGALSLLMRTELHELHESRGEPIAALWASEGGIYGRFGYGLASQSYRSAVNRPARFRLPAPPTQTRVRLLDADTALPAMRALHEEYVRGRVGSLSRPEQGWSYVLFDDASMRDGASSLRFAVHPDGYAIFRVKENWQPAGPQHEVITHELVSTSVEGHAAIWRFLLELDLVGEVRYFNAPLDEPMRMMLTDPRAVRTELRDALFVRLVDLDRALAARRYAGAAELVLDVTDALCPWNAGRWRLSVDASGTGTVERTTADADLACDVIDLGAAYLGSTKLQVLAAAGRVHELRPGAVAQASTVFAAENEPHCLEVF
ncbi:MAG TPA: GNAT family N-acetyltransferase [Actinomycetes bacterium]|nr:GNAT family N-acetyltransferase [Actinomycetes bacterium]